jgi:hypothetical protein
MKIFDQLTGKQRRAHLRWLRRTTTGSKYWGIDDRADYTHIRGEDNFRYAERLHRAGLITAAVSKGNMLGIGSRPFRELAVFLDEAKARAICRTLMVRRGR